MYLRKLIEGMDIIEVYGSIDFDIKNIEYDSRNISSEDLFICINGSNVNGHKFINNAIEKGAKAFIITEDVPMNENLTYIKVKDAKKAMSFIAGKFYENPSEKLNIIGVTGTNGKTSTSR